MKDKLEGVPVADWCSEWICRIRGGLLPHIPIIPAALSLPPLQSGAVGRATTILQNDWVYTFIYNFFQSPNFRASGTVNWLLFAHDQTDATYLFPDIIFACSSNQRLWIFNLGLSCWLIRYVIWKDLSYHFVWVSDHFSPRWDWNSQICTYLHNSQYFAGPIIKLGDSIKGLENLN